MLVRFRYRTKLMYKAFSSARSTQLAQLVLVVLLSSIAMVGLWSN